MLRKELRKRLATEYSYAADRIQQMPELARKLYYFSVLFGEAQRVLNWEWNRDLALVHMVTQQTYNTINNTVQNPLQRALFPIDWSNVEGQLTQATIDLAAYYAKATNKGNKEELYEILARLAELAYSVLGNGSYLHEKGHIKA